MSHYTRQQVNQIYSQHKDVSQLVNTSSGTKEVNWYKVYTRLARFVNKVARSTHSSFPQSFFNFFCNFFIVYHPTDSRCSPSFTNLQEVLPLALFVLNANL